MVAIYFCGVIFTHMQSFIIFSHPIANLVVFFASFRKVTAISPICPYIQYFDLCNYKMATSQSICCFSSAGGDCEGEIKSISEIHPATVSHIMDNTSFPFELICDFHVNRLSYINKMFTVQIR